MLSVYTNAVATSDGLEGTKGGMENCDAAAVP